MPPRSRLLPEGPVVKEISGPPWKLGFPASIPRRRSGCDAAIAAHSQPDRRRAGRRWRRSPTWPDAHGLEPDLHRHDLAALRAHPGHPGEEAPRDELWGLTVDAARQRTRAGALNGHVDVVGLGTARWRHGPATLEDGRLYGRGAVDMKGAVVAALHALAAVRAAPPDPDVVLQCVASEEDGGLGTFAALERDARVRRRADPRADRLRRRVRAGRRADLPARHARPHAHAAHRLEGCSAIDRYVRVHTALHALEAEINAGVAHPLMRELELPYPLLVGRVQRWRLVEPGPRPGRVRGAARRPGRRRRRRRPRAVRGRADARARRRRGARRGPLDRRRLPAGPDAGRPSLGGPVADAVAPSGRGARAIAGVPWGADMRLFTRPRHPLCDGRHERDRAGACGRRVGRYRRAGRARRILVRASCGYHRRPCFRPDPVRWIVLGMLVATRSLVAAATDVTSTPHAGRPRGAVDRSRRRRRRSSARLTVNPADATLS